ncbi:myozenin-2 isoform X2 [Denticeps clupeoides]|uniref:myozenin-2 isoform X2 n=1 Tax=Denticeps clupeoides TaxID=299321 RepID=UPI0010A3FC83|nr:myozenin-3 isoform X2 [Denticeps clupeoides]
MLWILPRLQKQKLGKTEGQEAQHCNKENPAGKSRMVNTLRQTVARKGKPSVLAPGYSGPLKEMPPEKFNVTVIPKSYSSPWQPDVRDLDSFVASISACLPDPPFKLMPASYKCFNRAPTPFGGTTGSVRMLTLPWFELQQAYMDPSMTWEHICDRPNFNRTPQGWSPQYTAGSEAL